MRRTLPVVYAALPAPTAATASAGPCPLKVATPARSSGPTPFRLAAWPALASLGLMLACSSSEPVAPPVPSIPEVVVEAARAGSATVGAEGGTVTATSAGGVVYRLVVPRGALIAPTELTITPVSALSNSPVSAGLSAVVRMAPSGLRFALPARLEIAVTPVIGSGSQLVAFQSASDGTGLLLRTTGSVAAALTLSIAHFSVYGVAVLTPTEIARIPRPPQSDAGGTALDAIARIPTGTASDVASIFRAWWTASVRPRLAQSPTDSALTFALSDDTAWRG